VNLALPTGSYPVASDYNMTTPYQRKRAKRVNTGESSTSGGNNKGRTNSMDKTTNKIKDFYESDVTIPCTKITAVSLTNHS
jgi:hypothetical protein